MSSDEGDAPNRLDMQDVHAERCEARRRAKPVRDAAKAEKSLTWGMCSPRHCGDGECSCVSAMNRNLGTFLDLVVIPAAATAAVVACLQLTTQATAGTLTDTNLQGAAQVEQLNQVAA